MANNVIDITPKLPHRTAYLVCVECVFDYVGVFPAAILPPFECPECGAKAVEAVNYKDSEWYAKFMVDSEFDKRMHVLLKAKRIDDEQQE